jgi:hypothetical protein
MLTCQRAADVLAGLETSQLAFAAEEIDELLGHALAVEADPDDLAASTWLGGAFFELTRHELGEPSAAIAELAAQLSGIEENLRSDWYRMFTGRAEILQRENDRVAIRRALGLLRDPAFVQALGKVVGASSQLAPGARWAPCAALGSELYGITAKGIRVRRALAPRLARFGAAPLKTFLHGFDKTDARMRAFATDVTTLNRNVGFVKKNREQVVIGLAKAGMTAGHALGAYHAAVRHGQPADVAVTCARNAQAYGSPEYAAAGLRYAQDLLRRAGVPGTPVAMGAAKALLAFRPPDAGVPRFLELVKGLRQAFGQTEDVFKYAARLLPAAGTPAEGVARAVSAWQLLRGFGDRPGGKGMNPAPHAVALGSMARTAQAIPELVARYRVLEEELVRAGLSARQHAATDALECVACPGTPIEVVQTVSAVVEQLSDGRPPSRETVAIAVAFAKRFAI